MSDKASVVNELKNDIADAEYIVVGLGTEWYSTETPGYDKGRDKEELISAYKKLKSLLGEKKYYIITLCYDDVIYEIFDEEKVKIVAPCGTKKMIQCDKHLMTWDEVEDANNPVCPVCGKKLVYNNILAEEYMEDGYIPKFQEYKTFLQTTVNSKLLILELGGDMKFPSVFRFPFDKLCVYNYKSKFYRITRKFAQHIAENSKRSVSVYEDSVEFVNNNF